MIMKKNILYLIAGVALIFTSCNPLKDSINDETPNTVTKTLTLTLAAADYDLLPTANYAKKGGYFNTVADANASIPVIFNAKYPHLGNGSKANVTYNSLPAPVKPADSLITSNPNPFTYTVTDADYASTNGNNFKNFSASKVLEFLTSKYPAAVNNQLSILTYTYFESGSTTSAGVTAVDTFVFVNGVWVKAYQVTQAQYISAGKLVLFNFGAADEPNLSGFFNTFLKSDANVSGKAKLGDVKYVAFAYFSSNKTYQRIKALIFDGTNWGTTSVPVGPLAFLRKSGKWIPDPTVYYTMIKADGKIIEASEAGTPAGRANVGSFGSFDVSGSANNWSDSQINDALIVLLKAKFPSAAVDPDVLYKVTYPLFKGSKPTAVKAFAKASSGFVFVPEEL